MKEIGQMTLSEALPYMQDIAQRFNLKLNRVRDWRLARKLMAITYYSQVHKD